MPDCIFDKLAKEICVTGRRVYDCGFCNGTDGNISARLIGAYPDNDNNDKKAGDDDRDLIVISPSGVSKGKLESSSLCVVNTGDGKLVRGERPSSEMPVHLAIYRNLPQVNAVIHTHAYYSVLWSCTCLDVCEGIHPEAEIILGRVPVVPYNTPGSDKLAQAVADHLQPATTALLMANHGPVTFGATLDEAMNRMEVLEAYLRLLFDLKQLGNCSSLTDAQMHDLVKLKNRGLDNSQ